MDSVSQIKKAVSLLHPYRSEFGSECGIDEAGRGCGAGPVVAAAVILPAGYFHPLLNDSKQITADTRQLLREHILTHALDYGIGMASVREIDRINILQATFLAMQRAMKAMHRQAEIYLIDGNRFKCRRKINYETVIDGDAKVASIAAASILAKTERDAYMQKLHQRYPHYKWDQNKGYLTAWHRQICRDRGLTVHHRRSFRILDLQEDCAEQELMPEA